MSIVAIMQPTYLPWSGYFNLIARATEFIFLDDVQFSHQSWQQRNRIVAQGRPLVLTVPVYTASCGQKWIRDVEVDDGKNWRKKHLRTIQQAYARHPFGREVTAIVERCLDSGNNRLADINIAIIAGICESMDMRPSFHRSSQLDIGGSRSERLLSMCRRFGADTYLSPRGSQEYIEDDAVFAGSEVKVIYQEFDPAPYPQLGATEFISHMSIIDLAANVGFVESRNYVVAQRDAEHVV